jgi:hypothetical protein
MRNLTLQSRGLGQIASTEIFTNRLKLQLLLSMPSQMMKFVSGWLRCLSFFLMLAAQIIL